MEGGTYILFLLLLQLARHALLSALLNVRLAEDRAFDLFLHALETVGDGLADERKRRIVNIS